MRAENKRKARPVKPSVSPAINYRRALTALVKRMEIDVRTRIIPILVRFEPDYANIRKDAFISDGYAITLSEAFDNLRDVYSNIGTQANIVATSFVSQGNQANKNRFYKAIENVVGVNLQSIIQGENLEDELLSANKRNVSLIKSIPSDYWNKIEQIVYTGTSQGNPSGSMIKDIRNATGVSYNRAKLIARDQSAKLNSSLTQQRSQNLGVEEYIWRSAEDSRVRPTHRRNNAKVFRWDDPPKDTGHPGNDINCRCVAQPIIKV